MRNLFKGSSFVERYQDVTCFLQFFVEIRRFPLRSKSRITFVRQSVGTSICSFVRLSENVPTPISLISSHCLFDAHLRVLELFTYGTDFMSIRSWSKTLRKPGPVVIVNGCWCQQLIRANPPCDRTLVTLRENLLAPNRQRCSDEMRWHTHRRNHSIEYAQVGPHRIVVKHPTTTKTSSIHMHTQNYRSVTQGFESILI